MQQVGQIAVEAKAELAYPREGLSLAEERVLIKRARRGDALAYEKLVNDSSRRIFAIVSRIVSNPSFVEDVAQNVYIKAWTGLREFKGKSRFSTWLYRIAINESLAYVRHETRRRGWEVDGEDSLNYASSGRHAEVTIIDKVTVREAMAKLPKAYSTAISLSYMEDLKYEEAAKIMEVPLNTFKTYMHRGKIKLRKILEGDEI